MHRMRQSLQLLLIPQGACRNTQSGEALWMPALLAFPGIRDILKHVNLHNGASPINVQNAANPTAAPCPSGNMREHTGGPLDVHSVGKPSSCSLPSTDTWGHTAGESLHMHAVPEGFPLALLHKEACANAQWGEALHMSAVWEAFWYPTNCEDTWGHTPGSNAEQPGLWGETSFSLQTWNASSTLEQNLVNGTLWEDLSFFTYFIQNLRAWQKSLNGYKYGFLPKCLVFDRDPGVFIHVLVHVANLKTLTLTILCSPSICTSYISLPLILHHHAVI